MTWERDHIVQEESSRQNALIGGVLITQDGKNECLGFSSKDLALVASCETLICQCGTIRG